MTVTVFSYYSNTAVTVTPRGEIGDGRKDKVPSMAVLAYPHKWEYDLKIVNTTDWPHPSNSRVYKVKLSGNATQDR